MIVNSGIGYPKIPTRVFNPPEIVVVTLYGKNYLMTIREYNHKNLAAMILIWNEVVEEGNAFPQEELLNEKTRKSFFSEQSYCGVAMPKDRGFQYCSLMLWWNQIFTPGIFMRESAFTSWGVFQMASE